MAPLKLNEGDRIEVWASRSSPWPTGRGPIEAHPTSVLMGRVLSALHGLLAVAPLKLPNNTAPFLIIDPCSPWPTGRGPIEANR